MTASPDTPPTPTPSKKAGERQAFLAAHPHCCFCYGENPTVEIDHVPARTCFRAKEGPEGFEFPACSRCNRGAALSEQVTALYIRFTDSSSQNFREEDFQRLFWGVANNAPEAVPQLDAETSRRLQTESRDDIGKPGALIVPRAAHQHLELFATKMLYAIYYRVSGDFAGPRHRRLVTWAQAGTEAATHVAQRSEQWFGDLNVGARSNVDLGDQFHYRQGYNAAHGYLGLSMSFGQSFVFFCVLGPGKQLATLNKLEPKAKRYQPIWQLGLALRKRTP
jgi:hypothetical protein